MDLHSMIQTNKRRWNEVTNINVQSKFYDVESFKAGKCTLKSIELEEIGDVKGKSLLHLQCHFGLDTLSWARLGAKVTGIDLSDDSINLAQSLNEELGLDAQFICSDVYNLPNALPTEKFDIVFTSYGVLCWLADINKWANIVGQYLKPGGTFFIVEGHPMDDILKWENDELKVGYPYFDEHPMKCSSQTTYADRDVTVENTESYQWQHSLGSILTSLTHSGGLKIQSLKEYPLAAYDKFPGYMEKDDDGWWKFSRRDINVPLLFSIKATK